MKERDREGEIAYEWCESGGLEDKTDINFFKSKNRQKFFITVGYKKIKVGKNPSKF